MTTEEKLQRLANLISTQTLERLQRQFPGSTVDWTRGATARIKPGAKYVKVDVGTSGKYMVDADGNIFGIKAYGVIHRGHRYGTLDTIEDWYWGGYAAIKRSATAKAG